MKCQNCGTDIPMNPEMEIEDGRLDQVVKHAYNPNGIAVKQTDYFCSRECATEAWYE